MVPNEWYILILLPSCSSFTYWNLADPVTHNRVDVMLTNSWASVIKCLAASTQISWNIHSEENQTLRKKCLMLWGSQGSHMENYEKPERCPANPQLFQPWRAMYQIYVKKPSWISSLVEPSDNTSLDHHLTAPLWETPSGNHAAKFHQPTEVWFVILSH